MTADQLPAVADFSGFCHQQIQRVGQADNVTFNREAAVVRHHTETNYRAKSWNRQRLRTFVAIWEYIVPALGLSGSGDCGALAPSLRGRRVAGSGRGWRPPARARSRTCRRAIWPSPRKVG